MKHDQTIITVKGRRPGKTVSIIGGIHGNEPCGVIAIIEALLTVPIERGKVHFILGNPRAIALGARYTEMNLNRAFKPSRFLSKKEKASYERKRAKELMPYLRESVAVLDIHSGSNRHATPFIICEPHSWTIAKYLDFPIISSGLDKVEPGGTDYFTNQKKPKGKGICIECGFHFDPHAPKRAFDSIKIFLMRMGNISKKGKLIAQEQKKIVVRFAYIVKKSFSLVRLFKDFEPVKKGTLIGKDGKEKIYSGFNGVIIFAKNSKISGTEAFLLAKGS